MCVSSKRPCREQKLGHPQLFRSPQRQLSVYQLFPPPLSLSWIVNSRQLWNQPLDNLVKTCLYKDKQITESSVSASDNAAIVEQNEEIISAAELNIKLTLNDDQEINLLEKSDAEIMSTTNGVGAGAEGATLFGDPRRLSVVSLSSLPLVQLSWRNEIATTS